jgi:hypothetical protein
MKDSIIEIVVLVAIFAVLGSIPLLLSAKCEAQWEDSGLQSRWGWLSGCLISNDGKRFIPDQRYREMQQNP